MTIRKQFVAAAMTGVLAGGGLVAATATTATATTAGAAGKAASCYDLTKTYSKPSGTRLTPKGSTFFKTTKRCNDINVKSSGADRRVRVCFYKPDGKLKYCQSTYKLAKKGTWRVIATDVKDGVKFKLQFSTPARAAGKVAA
ncbi:hypothetical protein [Streptomyces sp. DSM 40750]|uniref:hypothetical protein n=1 Tax=Streptomyces sp. DSM 40750 TaxID=2801030 RepID=UPI00214B6A28|nr:hypothetical protein [Streptomyces sp. DSM 40750]UUU24487.1 hypothetical protein JIX55_31875 [Streptomyces sp. DSM 40750]